jgi:Mce-associated membrane protein
VSEAAAGPEPHAAEEPPAPAVPLATSDRTVDPDHKARVRVLIALGVAAVLLVAGAVLLALKNHEARANGPLGNEAFVDDARTSQVVAEVTAAIKTVYSYDYKTLDANQAAAKAVITGRFADDFDKVFTPVKQLAPQQQAVLNTTVPAAGLLQLQDDRARLLVMADQQGTRNGSEQVAGTSARLLVEALWVDGHWKIAEVTPE